MKKFLFSICALLLMAVAVHAQTAMLDNGDNVVTVKQANCHIDAGGNYVAISQSTPAEPVKTDKTFTDGKGAVYPVYLNTKGRPFVFKVSRSTGNEYRYYLEPEAPTAIVQH